MRDPNSLSPTEKRALAALDVDALLTALDQLVSVPSLTGDASAAQETMAQLMADAGLTVDLWPIDLESVRRHPACCEEVKRDAALGLVGTAGDGDGRRLILNGHVDVVGPGRLENWRYDPWRATLDDGRVYGRGALDMKGGLICGLMALDAIRRAGLTPRGTVHLQSVVGEEDGGIGTLATVLRGYAADGAIVLEPTEMAIAPAQAGALNFRIEVPGLAAHGCMREEGVSAIERFIPLYQALMRFEATRNSGVDDPLFNGYRLPYPISVGTIRGGEWPSTVPERLEIEGRYGIRVGESPAAARADFERCVAGAAAADPWLREHPPRVTWWGGQFESAGIDIDAPIVTAVREGLAAATARAPVLRGMTYGADMRLLVHYANTPTVLFGPGDVRLAHKPDESVPLADLIDVTRALIVTILRYCGYR